MRAMLLAPDAIRERLSFPQVSGMGDARVCMHSYFDHYFPDRFIRSRSAGVCRWYAESLGNHLSVEDAKRAVFEWFAINRPL